MGKITGFIDYERKNNVAVEPLERIKNFNEFYNQLDEAERREQGGRCMDCGVPFCGSAIELKGMVTGCPLHNLVPEWNNEVFTGNYAHGLARLLKTNPFPEFTGRVCPALCEKACICGMHGDPVTVRNNELFIIETAYKAGNMTPKIPAVRSGKKVAVIGSGPSGLAVAEKLNKRGHYVTVLERDDQVGGLLMYGIPNMKLDKSVIARRVALMEAEGVVFKTNMDYGKNLSPAMLEAEFDAIVLCCGAKKARDLNVKNRDSKGIYMAIEYLTSATKNLLTGSDYISAKGKSVVVVGGGDTGNDCVGTAIRHGAKSVVQIEMMGKPPVVRAESNPWPEWPKVLLTDYGQQEAIAVFGEDPRVFNTTVKKVIAKSGKVTAVETVNVAFKDGKLTFVEGTEKTIPADLVLIAAGFVGYEDYVTAPYGTEIPNKQAVSYKTNKDKVFACGDMKRGQSLVVWALREGVRCAKEVDEFLMY
ncbi:MAG: glutamate synthase subunit beta [Bacillota bacterium]